MRFLNFLRRLGKGILVFLAILLVVYIFGPSPNTPKLDRELPTIPSNLADIEQMVIERESADSIRPGNGGYIAWANDARKERTPYSVLYLHGFSASPVEGDPIHREFAERYGCNLYVPRLADHGLVSDEPMLNYEPESAIASAKEALAIAQALGDSVIVLSCSTGGTLALYLAGGENKIKGLVAFSPNVAMFPPESYLLNKPWGLQIARAVKGSDYYEWEGDEFTQKHWYTKYRYEALTQLQELVEATMTSDNFEEITKPVFMGYYYKDEINQDQVVSVPAMLEMFDELGTPEARKRKVAFPNAGVHVINSAHKSGDYENVRDEAFRFTEEVLGLRPQ